MKDLMKNMLLWVTVAVVLMMVFQGFSPRAGNARPGARHRIHLRSPLA